MVSRKGVLGGGEKRASGLYFLAMANPQHFPDSELVERNPKLDVDALHRAGVLHAGEVSSWACRWLMVTIRAEWERLWIGDQEVVLARDRFLNGRHVRIKFLCPACSRGCRILHARGRTFVCRTCAGYDYSSRHKDHWAPALARLASLRRRIELGHPLHGWSKRRLREAMLAYECDVAESLHGFVAKLEARLGHGRHDANERHDANVGDQPGGSLAGVSRGR